MNRIVMDVSELTWKDPLADEIVNTEKDTNLFVGKIFQSWDLLNF